MKINELLRESAYRDTNLPLGKYRGSYDPRTMQHYSNDYADSSELVDAVYDLIDDGYEPQVVNMDPKNLTATQDWLSDYGSDEAMFDEYTDRPVVLKDGQTFYILDGHHRVAKALKANRPISVYLFDELD